SASLAVSVLYPSPASAHLSKESQQRRLPASERASQMLDRNPTPSEVEHALERAGANRVHVSEPKPARPVNPMSGHQIAAKTLKVRSMWADYHKKGKKHIVFYGFWNFRDDF